MRRKSVGGALAVVDRRWCAGAGMAFPPASGQGKAATSLQGERRCSMALWRGLLGVNAKKSHVLRLDEAVPVTDQSYVLQSRSTVFPIGRDAPP